MSIKKQVNNLSEEEVRAMLLQLIDDSYILVDFPEVQKYMSKPWFKEEAELGPDSSYFIPTKRTL